MKTKTIALILLALSGSAALVAQNVPEPEAPADSVEEYYSNPLIEGSNALSISLGGLLPISFYNTLSGESSATQLDFGFTFTAAYERFIAKSLSAGLTFSGMFSSTITRRQFYMLPLTAKLTYYFVFMPIEIGPTLEAGGTWMKLGDYLSFQPIAKAGSSILWRNAAWSFGLNILYWMVPELYSGDLAADSRIGNFLEFSLSATYHF